MSIELKQACLQEIETDRERGASQLARRCLEMLSDYAAKLDVDSVTRLQRELQKFADELKAARPSMAPVENLLRAFDTCLSKLPSPVAAAVHYARRQAAYLVAESEQAVLQVAQHAAGLVKTGDTILTHSISSTVVEIFRCLQERSVKAVITESRPGNEGQLLATELSKLSISTEYITEAQAGLFVGRCDIVLVGADTLLADGSVVNKAGTFLLALAACEKKIPFYVCCESFKQTSKTDVDIELEEKSGAELELPPLSHITPRNIYFDITPARLISGHISERGITSYHREPDPLSAD